MIRFFFLGVFLVHFWSPIYTQTVKLDVNGVRFTTSRAEVRKKLGRPSSDKIGGDVPCDGGAARRTIRYPGLILRLASDPGEPEFGVYAVGVTSGRWSVSGVRIGSTKNVVLRKLGKGKALSRHEPSQLGYVLDEGYADFYFTKNRLTKVFWQFNFC